MLYWLARRWKQLREVRHEVQWFAPTEFLVVANNIRIRRVAVASPALLTLRGRTLEEVARSHLRITSAASPMLTASLFLNFSR